MKIIISFTIYFITLLKYICKILGLKKKFNTVFLFYAFFLVFLA